MRRQDQADASQIKAILTSNIYVILAFLDLVRNGQEKKIIHTSSNSGDVEFNRITAIPSVVGYGAAKAAMNLAMSKFAAELAPEGFKFLSMAPGWVATDAGSYPPSDSLSIPVLTLSSRTSHGRPGNPQVDSWGVPQG